MSIRQYIIDNFQGDDYDSLRSAINESIESQDEVTLPGMGVFFEIIWQDGDEDLKNKILDIIKKRVDRGKNENNEQKQEKETN